MKKALLFLAGLVLAFPAQAQVAVGGQYIASPPTLSDGQQQQFRLDSTGALVTSGGSGGTGASASQVQGNVAASTTDSGNPVKTGCYAAASSPTAATAGQRQNSWCDLNGASVTRTVLNNTTITDGTTSVGFFGGNTSINSQVPLVVAPSLWNGTSLSYQRGDTTGAWAGGHSSLNTGQVSVGTTSTLVAAARTGRQKITMNVGAANTCAFGNTGVTTTTGFPLQPTAGASLTIDTAAAVYAVCSATTTVSYLEQY